MADTAVDIPDDTQKMSTQVYDDYYKRQASPEASLATGDQGHVTFSEISNIGQAQDTSPPPTQSQHELDQDADELGDQLPATAPQTPAIAGSKRDSRGNIVSSVLRTPASALSAMFKTVAAPTNVLQLSQLFHQTQQPSSPGPDGPQSDPIFERPSPDVHTHHHPSPLTMSSPVLGRRMPPSETPGRYVSMQESQERRDLERSRVSISSSSPYYATHRMTSDEFDEEDSLQMRLARNAQRKRIQKDAERGLSNLVQAAKRADTDNPREPLAELTDIVTSDVGATPATGRHQNNVVYVSEETQQSESMRNTYDEYDELSQSLANGDTFDELGTSQRMSIERAANQSRQNVAVANSQPEGHDELAGPMTRNGQLLPSSEESDWRVLQSQRPISVPEGALMKPTPKGQMLQSSPVIHTSSQRAPSTPVDPERHATRRRRTHVIPDTSPAGTAEEKRTRAEVDEHDESMEDASPAREDAAPLEQIHSKESSTYITVPTQPSFSPRKRSGPEPSTGDSMILSPPRRLRDIAAEASPARNSSGEVDIDINILDDDDIAHARLMSRSVPPLRASNAPPAKSSLGRTHTRKSISFQEQSPELEQEARPANAILDTSRDTSSTTLQFPRRVLASFSGQKIAYYPATYLGKSPGDAQVYKIRFDDGNVDDIKEQHVRSFQLQEGDSVRIDQKGLRQKSYFVHACKNTEAATETNSDAHGNTTVTLTARARDSTSGDPSAEEQAVEVPLSSIYLTGGAMWAQLRNRPGLGMDEIEKNLHHTEATSNSGLQGLQSTLATDNAASHAQPSRLFNGMGFVVTYHTKGTMEKESIEELIVTNGGRLLPNGFDSLFEDYAPASAPVAHRTNRKGAPTTSNTVDRSSKGSLQPSLLGKRIGFVALLADAHSRRPKHMQALALNLPCLSGRWIHDCVKQSTILPWTRYLLPAGESHLLDGATRSRILRGPHAHTLPTFSEMIAHRHCFLDGRHVVVCMSKAKATDKVEALFRFLCQILGARDVRVENKSAGQHHLDELVQGEGKHGEMVVSDEYVLQSLILGELLDG